MGKTKQNCVFLSVLVIYIWLKGEKNLTLKTCAQIFSARLMTKLYAKIKGERTISLLTFFKLGRYAVIQKSGATNNSSERNKSYWVCIGWCPTVGGKCHTLKRVILYTGQPQKGTTT